MDEKRSERLDALDVGGSQPGSERVLGLVAPGERLRAEPGLSFSTREAAALLGVAEASVKRLSDAGTLSCQRSEARGVRRYGHAQLTAFLRKRGSVPGPAPTVAAAAKPFALAAAKDDLAGGMALVLDLCAAGVSLESMLDALVAPAAALASDDFVKKLLERVWPLGPRERRRGGSAMVIPIGHPRAVATEMVRCLLRSRGLEAVKLAEGLAPREAGNLAARSEACVVVVVFSGELAAAAVEREAIDAARALAAALPPHTVCAVGPRLHELPSGVDPIRSMSDLAAFIGGAEGRS